MNRFLLLGIDSSLGSTGLAFRVVTESSMEPIQSATLTPPPLVMNAARLSALATSLELFLDGLRTKALAEGLTRIAAIERGAICNGSAIGLAEWGGIVRMLCFRAGFYPFVDVPPATLKLGVSGNGSADKEAMAVAVRSLTGRHYSNDDEVDAVALVLFLQRRMNLPTPGSLTPKQLATIAKPAFAKETGYSPEWRTVAARRRGA